MLDSSSSDEEETGPTFYFWNNWVPPAKADLVTFQLKESSRDESSTGTWIPPLGRKSKRRKTEFRNENEIFPSTTTNLNETIAETKNRTGSLEVWGQQFPYGASFNDVEDNKLVWKIFHVGVFGNFKLTKNDFGLVTAYADAEINNTTDREVALLVINNEVLLRKILGISSDEWSALKDALGDKKWNLIYEAMKPVNLQKFNALEKLWYYICKRRHHLPTVAIRMRRSGVHKMTQLLKMLPKFIVEDILTFSGQGIP